MRIEEIDQRRTVGLAAFTVAKRIQVKGAAVEHTKIIKNTRAAANDFGIGQTVTRPEIFDPDLMELAHASLLRPLIAEHRPGIEELQRQALRESVGDHRPHHAGGVFRAQCQRLAATVGEVVGFLGDHIAAVAERTREHLGKLEHRRRHLLKAVKARGGARRADHPLVAGHRGWHEIRGSPGGLQTRHIGLVPGMVSREDGIGRVRLGPLRVRTLRLP